MFVTKLFSCFASILVLIFLSINQVHAQTPSLPFPQAKSFTGKIKPNHVTQAKLNSDVASYFSYWKTKYVRQSNGVTPGGGYYVNMQGTGGTGSEITTSEAHGYGMMLFALMAGYDPDAKKYFDGMFNMYDKHRSTGNSHLMSWIIDQSESTSADSGSATDGDMDIAYALLLAHYQWGSAGGINYLGHAKRIINSGLKGSSVNLTSKRTTLGDWDASTWSTRSSDWMTGHMRAYFNATGDTFWNDAANTAYNLIGAITQNYASATGLMPDFVVANPPKPAPAYFLEAATDGKYSWNACRYPLRIAMDAAHFQSAQAKTAMSKLVNWIVNLTAGQPSGIVAGYNLNGSPLVGYSDMAFTAPMIAAATVAEGSYQTFVNRGWTLMASTKNNYYADSVNLLSMLFVSGNWWAPVGGAMAPPPVSVSVTASGDDGNGHTAQKTLDGSLDPESRWSANGAGQWIMYDLGESKTVTSVDMAFYLGNQRRYSFEIYTGATPTTLTRALTATSSGASLNFQRFDFSDRSARFVKIVGYGSNANRWNAFTEVKINRMP